MNRSQLNPAIRKETLEDMMKKQGIDADCGIKGTLNHESCYSSGGVWYPYQ